MDEIETMSYETAYQQLEALVASLESGELSLEESVSVYERGQKLSAHCQALLENAQLKVKMVDDAGLME